MSTLFVNVKHLKLKYLELLMIKKDSRVSLISSGQEYLSLKKLLRPKSLVYFIPFLLTNVILIGRFRL